MKIIDLKNIRKYWYIALSCCILFLQVINIIFGELRGTHFVIPLIDPASYIIIFAILYRMILKLKTIAINFDMLPVIKAIKIGVNIIGYLLLIVPIDLANNYWHATDTVYLSGHRKIELTNDFIPTDYVYSLYSCQSYVCKKLDTDLSYSEDNSYTKNMKLVQLLDSSKVAIIRSGIITDIVDVRNGKRIDMPYVNMNNDTTNCKICTKLIRE